MSLSFWLKRSFIVLVLCFAIIGGVEYLKTDDATFAAKHAAIWAVLSTAIYLFVLWRKLRQNPACAIKSQERLKKQSN